MMMKKPEKSFSGFSGFSYAIRILQQTRQMCTAAVDAQSAPAFCYCRRRAELTGCRRRHIMTGPWLMSIVSLLPFSLLHLPLKCIFFIIESSVFIVITVTFAFNTLFSRGIYTRAERLMLPSGGHSRSLCKMSIKIERFKDIL